MFPGPNDIDWQVATFRHREFVLEGVRQQQMVASANTVIANPRTTESADQFPLGRMNARAAHRLRGLQSIVIQSLSVMSGGVASRG